MRGLTSCLLPSLVCIALAGCSEGPRSEESNMSEAPDIAPSAAPNVHFRYAYDFSLPAARISAVQEQHAAACEALGISRCRITGVLFSRDEDDRVSASLSLAVVPAIARKFGKDATALVEGASGTLRDLRFTGEDQSSALQAGTDKAAGAKAERARLEAEANRPGVDAKSRAQLQAQISEQIAIEREGDLQQRDVKAVLASAPVDFHYASQPGWSGIRFGSMAMSALYTAGQLLNLLLGLLVILLVIGVPLGLVFLALAHLHKAAGQLWKRLGPREDIAPAS